MEEQSSYTIVKPRKAFVAFLLSLFTPGLGQVYNGQPQKGIIFFALIYILLFIFGITQATHTFYGLSALLLLMIALEITIIVDAVRNAKKRKEYVLKRYNTVFYYLLIFSGMFLVNSFVNTRTVIGIQYFSLPTTSGNPTLQAGDWVVANMRAYNNNQPDYGDIVVFNNPEGKLWVFRVVGLPYDTIELNSNIVTLNGKMCEAIFVKDTTNDGAVVQEFVEKFPNGHKHNIYRYKEPYDSTMASVKDIVVPADCYYLLGDNRDNAADSRYIGAVKKQDILGQVMYSYWGKTPDRINIDLRDK